MFTEKNAVYLIAGYVVFLGGITVYLLSLALRRHNQRRDRELLEQIEQQLAEEQHEQAAPEQPTADEVRVK